MLWLCYLYPYSVISDLSSCLLISHHWHNSLLPCGQESQLLRDYYPLHPCLCRMMTHTGGVSPKVIKKGTCFSNGITTRIDFLLSNSSPSALLLLLLLHSLTLKTQAHGMSYGHVDRMGHMVDGQRETETEKGLVRQEQRKWKGFFAVD